MIYAQFLLTSVTNKFELSTADELNNKMDKINVDGMMDVNSINVHAQVAVVIKTKLDEISVRGDCK